MDYNREPRSRVEPMTPGWLYQHLRFLVGRWRRGRSRHERKVKALATAPTRRSIEAPVVTLVREETSEIVREALSKLSETDRALILLKFQDAKTYAEIAGLLGCCKQTIGNRLRDAFIRLRDNLTAEGWREDR